MQRILVTGASGFVGRHLVAHLLNQGHRVIACHRQTLSLPWDFHPNLQHRFITDIEDIRSWGKAELGAVDVVIHLAAKVHETAKNTSQQLEAYRRINSAATRLLAEKAAHFGVKRFIFLSSIKVNGEKTAGRPFTADDQPNPQCPYAVSKAEAEEAMKTVSADTGIDYVIIRPPLVYGPGVKANFDRLYRWVRRGYPLPVGALNNRRSLVSVFNLVDLLGCCAAYSGSVKQVFLVSDGESISTSCLVQRISSSLKRDVWMPKVPVLLLRALGAATGRSELIARLCDDLEINIDKTAAFLNWVPPLAMSSTLDRMIADGPDR